MRSVIVRKPKGPFIWRKNNNNNNKNNNNTTTTTTTTTTNNNNMGTGVGQAQLQPTTGMWTLLPTRVRGGTFGKYQQPFSQG